MQKRIYQIYKFALYQYSSRQKTSITRKGDDLIVISFYTFVILKKSVKNEFFN